jgi:GTP-binding protein
MGQNRHGANGESVVLKVPTGTEVLDEDKETVIADLNKAGMRVLLARGGNGGFGNAYFKSSVNQAPEHANPGQEGEERVFWLRLKLIADAGLVGLPNAGKSTFLRAVSSATPKVADYPFTTLQPHLGVVRIETDKSFVIADIPGLIEGAAEGAGLGIQFLKHVARTRLLLHMVDIAPLDDEIDPVEQVRTIERELARFDPELLQRERWLVFNKLDLVPEEDRQKVAKALVKKLKWKQPWYLVSALARENTWPICLDIQRFFDERRRDAAEAAANAEAR